VHPETPAEKVTPSGANPDVASADAVQVGVHAVTVTLPVSAHGTASTVTVKDQ
jgi:hypothetical protein